MRGFRCPDAEVPGVLLQGFVDRVFVGLTLYFQGFYKPCNSICRVIQLL